MVFVNEKLKPFKFVLLKRGEKVPFESNWQNKGYSFNDAFLVEHVCNGGNYGVLTGHGLVVLDVDPEGVEAGLLASVKRNLVDTFTVRTPRGGRHFYYVCDCPTIRLGGEKIGKFGDVKGLGGQVVGPGSVVGGKFYVVDVDVPIHQISFQELLSAVRQWLPLEPKRSIPSEVLSASFKPAPFKMCDVLDLSCFKRQSSGELVGRNPVHGSDTGTNLHVNGGVWYCWRCRGGGGVWDWLAVSERLIECGNRIGRSDRLVWRGVFELARKRGLTK